jgi:hypothetical protein
MPTRETEDLGLVSVRAKFIVSKVEFYNPNSRRIDLKPVYSEDPNHENKQFWDATPSGEMWMIVNNPRAAEFFEPGREYYIDFVHPSKMASLTVREELERIEAEREQKL